jgi:hypothetical protein
MGSNRTLEKTREKLGKPSGYMRVLESWSSDRNWGRRVDLYDEHLAGVAVQSAEDGIRQDRIAYRDTVKREAAEFAAAAVAMRKKAERISDEAAASQVLQRASAVWERARQVEGMALGLVSE